MTDREIREAQELGLVYVPADQVPSKWTGRKRMDTPERPAMLGKMVPIYDHNTSSHPDRIRVSFDDGSTVVYVLDVTMVTIDIILTLRNMALDRMAEKKKAKELEKQ